MPTLQSLRDKYDDEATSSRLFSPAQVVKCKANFVGVELLIHIQVHREKWKFIIVCSRLPQNAAVLR